MQSGWHLTSYNNSEVGDGMLVDSECESNQSMDLSSITTLGLCQLGVFHAHQPGRGRISAGKFPKMRNQNVEPDSESRVCRNHRGTSLSGEGVLAVFGCRPGFHLGSSPSAIKNCVSQSASHLPL